jgi:hypothetical protein
MALRAGAYSALNAAQRKRISEWIPAPPAAVRDDAEDAAGFS